MRNLLLVVFAVVGFVGCNDKDPSKIQMNSDGCGSKGSYTFCVRPSENPSANRDVVYYFHMAGGDAQEGSDFFNRLTDTFQKMGVPRPAMVSISFGTFWLFSRTTGSGASLMNEFTTDAIPSIEAQLGNPSGVRFLVGTSMGGFNAAQIYLTHPELFGRVALLCPALSGVSPYASSEEVFEYVNRTGADYDAVTSASEKAKAFFADERSWNEESPLGYAAEVLTPAHPTLFISVGDIDEYGFAEGAAKFSALAQAKGVPYVTDAVVSGGHCLFDEEKLLNFVTR
jgi:pimeloyl-ACP methyl ester carboxylesterase